MGRAPRRAAPRRRASGPRKARGRAKSLHVACCRSKAMVSERSVAQVRPTRPCGPDARMRSESERVRLLLRLFFRLFFGSVP